MSDLGGPGERAEFPDYLIPFWYFPTKHLEEHILQVFHVLDFEHMLLFILLGSQSIDVLLVHQRPNPKHVDVWGRKRNGEGPGPGLRGRS